MLNNKGFSLVEVLAALVIISILLTGYLQIFTTTDKIAVNNNEKLVVINLADAYLERLQIEKFKLIPLPSTKPAYIFSGTNINAEFSETYSSQNCLSKNIACDFYTRIINDRTYEITLKASQNKKEFDIGIINILITVNSLSGKNTASVEGYLSYE